MATITSAGTGNSNATATWVGGAVPDADDDVVIDSGHTVTQNANATFNSLAVNGTFVASSSYSLTIDGQRSNGRALDIVGTFTHGNGTITITTAADTDLRWPSSSEAYNITINHASCVARPTGDKPVIANDLTITAGEYNTLDSGGSTNHALTVKGNTLVDGTLTGNNSTLSFGTDGVHGSTEGGCLLVNSSGTFTFGSGDVTIFSGFTAKGSEASPNVTSTGGGDIIIKGRTNNGFMNSHSHHGVNITGDYIIDYDNNAIFDNRGGNTIDCGNFIIKHGGRTYEPWNNTAQATFKIIGNMDIQNGTFDTEYSGQDSQHLTVTGEISIAGTLKCNSSTITNGSASLAASDFDPAGNLTLDSCTFKFYCGSSGNIYLSHTTLASNTSTLELIGMQTFSGRDMGLSASSGNLHNLTVTKTGSVTSGFRLTHNTTLGGNLTIETGATLDTNTSDKSLTVTGDASVTGTLTGNASAISFGSLEIASGGTYSATSGTTTITTGGTIAGTTNMAFGGEGTFTHNNGTILLDSTLHRIPRGGTFYNLTLNGEQSTDGIYGYTTTMLPQAVMPDGTTDANYMSILGTLQINNDEFRPYNTDKIYVHNLIIGDGTGSANSAKFDMSEADTFDGTVFVDNVTINSDGQLLFGDGDETSSTVGSSALNIYGAFRNLGGNVTIE